MQPLLKTFATQKALIAHVNTLASWAKGEHSNMQGGRQQAERKLARIDPIAYAGMRNFGDGHLTRLSPYIHHGILTLNEVRHIALTRCQQPAQITTFIQQLARRDFWQRVYASHPEWMWKDVEPYKTGFSTEDHAPELPSDIAEGRTGVACIDAFIQELTATGYLHDHAPIYLTAYVV